ncbi:MAG: pyridoxal-phosphate-dependent aminotransferase family protein [Thermoanaerobaculia bacterium]
MSAKPPYSGTVKFFLPGPVWVRPEVLAALSKPMIGHRGKSYADLQERIEKRIPSVFDTKNFVLLATSSATGLMEAGLQNANPGRVLSVTVGAFSERWNRIATDNGFEADTLSFEWGEAADPDRIRKALREKKYDAVTVVHNETSTGVISPLAEIAKAVRESSEAFLLVDAVTSLAGAPVETDAWGVDLVLAGSQKALALPPGLAVGAVSRRLLDRSRSAGVRSHYFRFSEYEEFSKKHHTPTTPSIPHLYALDVQLGFFEQETLEARFARHRALRARVESWATGNGSSFFPKEASFRSPTVSCLRPPAGFSSEKIKGALSARGWTIGGGYGKLKNDTFRISHMGDVDADSLEALLAEIDRVLPECRA